MNGILNWYTATVSSYPFQAAFIQFAVFGMAGDLIAASVTRSRINYTLFQFIKKMLAWGILGLFIKVGFIGMHGFTVAVFEKLHISLTGVLLFAFCKSFFTNTILGPQMMLFHRFEDNLLQGTKGYRGMDTAIKSLVWFWIPAHTFTFSMTNHDVQVGLAAAWSLVLGFILGLARRKK
jgi:hypothetical protein